MEHEGTVFSKSFLKEKTDEYQNLQDVRSITRKAAEVRDNLQSNKNLGNNVCFIKTDTLYIGYHQYKVYPF